MNRWAGISQKCSMVYARHLLDLQDFDISGHMLCHIGLDLQHFILSS